jgi:magnesium chelatase family protein
MPIILHANIQTVAFHGIDTIAVYVQVHIANGFPAMAIFGLVDKSVAEPNERVRKAITSIGFFCLHSGSRSIWHLPMY